MKKELEAVRTIVKRTFRIFKGEGINGLRRRLYKLSGSSEMIVDKDLLNITMNKIYDMPDVVVSVNRQPTINVLVPAFDFRSISAGFFGVFQAALFMKRIGYNVRLVMFDTFYFNYREAKEKFKDYPGLETLFNEVEVEYIGDRKSPLYVSNKDTSLATVWYSAYLAEKIQKKCDNSPFFYLIQDYETHFYPGSTNSLLADQSYKMNYNALFSTQPLADYFIKHNIGGFADRNVNYIVYNNCCSCSLPTYDEFCSIRKAKRKKKLVFYSRPVVNRNMYELGSLLIIKAVEEKILDPEEWEFYGVGLGDAKLKLADGLYLQQLPRMTLKEYIESISAYDLGITLMASSHPSLLPFDLAGSGCVVVTNECYEKKQKYFNDISRNIIACEPDLYELFEGVKLAVKKVEDLGERYENAKTMDFPKSWDDTWTDEHVNWMKNHLNFNVYSNGKVE